MAAILAAIVILSLAAQYLAVYIPFSTEQRIAAHFEKADKSQSTPLTHYLQNLANGLAKSEQLPAGMTITVHYIDSDIVNALATLGGHIFIFRGLLEAVPNENALAMVMAHEIGHIEERHPVKSLSRAAVAGLAVSLVSSAAGNSIMDQVLGQSGLLTALKFSRDQERQADEDALDALERHYGHLNGANTLFEILDKEAQSAAQPPELYNSHPPTQNRMNEIRQLAQSEHWNLEGPLTPLPDHFKEWLQKSGE